MNRVHTATLSLVFLAFTACFSKDLGGIKPGATCSQNSACASNICMGSCCLTTCGSDPTCQGTSCDDTGACVYPSGSCGTTACDATTSQLTTSACSQGACVPGTPAACPGHLTCADATSCRGSCSLPADCVAGFACSSGTCQPQVPAGSSCTSNDACTSGVCGAAGSGHCCSAACLTADSHGCGASDCDSTGACVYPSATTSCVTQVCLGHTLTEPATCNGQGSCSIPAPATSDCAPYQCTVNETCATGCGNNAGCSVGFCHFSTHVCCPPYPGNQIEVDGTQGQDVGCCGGGSGTSACATIGYAVALVGEIASPGVTVHVANPPDGTNWTGDAYPIQLSYGVVLSAPGLDFSSDAGARPIFTIQPFGAETATSAVIEGSATQVISIGIDSAGIVPPLIEAVAVNPPMTLFLLNASLHDSLRSDLPYFYCSEFVVSAGAPFCNTAILVAPGATLTLGTDGFGSSGTVFIGDGTRSAQESVGIGCWGTLDGGAIGVVNDTGSTANPSTWIQNQGIGLALTDGCSAHLTAFPRFGKALNAMGTCDLSTTNYFDIDATEVYLNNGIGGLGGITPTHATISNATIECALVGVHFDPFPPQTFDGDGDLIQYNLTGVMALNGSFQPTNTTVSHNFVGIETLPTWEPGEGANLTGGGNQVSCNGALESELHLDTGPGMNVFAAYGGSGSNTLSVANTAWNHWDADAGHTQLWNCTDGTYSSCTCSGASSCPSPSGGPLPPGADIVFAPGLQQAPLSVDDSNGSAAANGCP